MRGSIDYNIIVDIPADAHVCSDNRLYVVIEKRYYQQLGYNLDHRMWIGKAISEKQMHPNDTYKEKYRETLEGVQHLNLPEYIESLSFSFKCSDGHFKDLSKYSKPKKIVL